MRQNQQNTRTVKGNRNTNISLVILCRSFQVFTMGGIALFLPLIREDIRLSFTQGGTLSAIAILAYALMQIPVGYLTDRFGPRRLFFIGILGTTFLTLTFGLVTEYWQALANQILVGVFRAFLFVPEMTLLAGWFPARWRSTATAMSQIGVLIGSLVLGIAGPLMVAKFDWRFPFISFALLGIVTSFIFLRFSDDPPVLSVQRKSSIREISQLFGNSVMWLCGALQYVRLAVVQGIAFWLPTFLIEDKGLSLQLTGIVVAVQIIFRAPSGILGGYISDRIRKPTLVIGASLIILAITVGFLATANNIILLIALIGIYAIFAQMYFGSLFAVPVEILGNDKAGIARGFSNLFANIGSFSFVYLLGFLKDTTASFKNRILYYCRALRYWLYIDNSP
ncbi:MFS transporter [Chloroflexota bacterium]